MCLHTWSTTSQSPLPIQMVSARQRGSFWATSKLNTELQCRSPGTLYVLGRWVPVAIQSTYLHDVSSLARPLVLVFMSKITIEKGTTLEQYKVLRFDDASAFYSIFQRQYWRISDFNDCYKTRDTILRRFVIDSVITLYVIASCNRFRTLSRNRLICRTFAAGFGVGQFIALDVYGQIHSKAQLEISVVIFENMHTEERFD